jgi:hypothetical protein
VVYIPPNDFKMQKEVQRLVTCDIARKKRDTHYIVSGDFNRISNAELDTTSPQVKGRKPQLPLVKWMKSLGYEEVFRSCNPTVKKYTWSNSKTKTRIDHIWVSNRIKEGVQKSDIEEMDIVTGSDHNLIWGSISTAPFLGFENRNLSKLNIRNTPKRRIYLYQKASEEDWENYKSSLDNILSEASKEREEEFRQAQEDRIKAEDFINKE